jgi:hypothetical protein
MQILMTNILFSNHYFHSDLYAYSRILVLIISHKGNNKITELRTILQRESQNS